jgi:hypothetical protein
MKKLLILAVAFTLGSRGIAQQKIDKNMDHKINI